MKLILILIALLGIISYACIVMTASPTDKDTYKAYERYKERCKHERHDI